MTSGHTALTTVPAVLLRRGNDFGCAAVRRQHQRRARGHRVDVVDEHHAEVAETLDDEPVVHDLVVAVHGRLEDPHHPRQRLDRHLHAGAEAAGLGEQHLIDAHALDALAPDWHVDGSRLPRRR